MLAMSELAPWLSWVPRWLVAAIAATVAVIVKEWVERWLARRRSEADTEEQAIKKLREYLGRQKALARVGERTATALDLRVHQAIPLGVEEADVDGTVDLDPDLPMFVGRGVLENEILVCMRKAATTGGFLVLVGGSSVGKTRLLYEAARAELTDSVVLAPDLGNGKLINTVAKATFPLPKLLVWVDELQRFLDGPYQADEDTAIDAETIRHLLGAPRPVVLLGTIWPAHVTALRAVDPDPTSGVLRPRYPTSADIFNDPRLRQVTVGSFSEDERREAALLAGRDPRLALAIADRDFNVTEVLAGAPEIVRRYEQGGDPMRAIVHAAVDARRVGVQAPLPPDLLRAAARGYLTGVYPDDSWFAAALEELASTRRRSDRATAPLVSVLSADRRTIVGYTVADYLLQRLIAQRRTVRIPDVTWYALVDHVSDPSDQWRVARSAEARRLRGIARAIYKSAVESGQSWAAIQLADLLERRATLSS